MKHELSSSQASPTGFDEPTAMYDILARSLLAREYKNAFLDATGLSVQLVPRGEAARPFSFEQKENLFCSLMTQAPGSCQVCQQTHTELQRRLTESLTPQVICCFAGLVEFAVPVVVDGQHVATLLGGQVFQRKPTKAQFARLRQRLRAWNMHQELPRLEAAFFQTRVTSPKQFQATVQLLALFAKFLARDVYHDLLVARAHDGHSINIAKNFILAHASEPLHLRDVAEQVHVSTNYFSRFFKKSTGMGFSEFLTRARVENAKNKLANPVLPINEVADQAGFGSLSQFNRAFHHYVGCSPKEYRASLLQDHSH
jgi:AraC-like DNA-binding protein/ligand-binding sensor protein